jgi:hypothetical protein
MRYMGNAYKIWRKTLKGRDQPEDIRVDGKNNITMELRKIEYEAVEWPRSG